MVKASALLGLAAMSYSSLFVPNDTGPMQRQFSSYVVSLNAKVDPDCLDRKISEFNLASSGSIKELIPVYNGNVRGTSLDGMVVVGKRIMAVVIPQPSDISRGFATENYGQVPITPDKRIEDLAASCRP